MTKAGFVGRSSARWVLFAAMLTIALCLCLSPRDAWAATGESDSGGYPATVLSEGEGQGNAEGAQVSDSAADDSESKIPAGDVSGGDTVTPDATAESVAESTSGTAPTPVGALETETAGALAEVSDAEDAAATLSSQAVSVSSAVSRASTVTVSPESFAPTSSPSAATSPSAAVLQVQASSSGLATQRTLAEGRYILVAGTTRGKVMDVSGASKKAGANVILWTYNGGENQVFTLKYNSDGSVRLIGIGGNVVEAASAGVGANVRMGAWKNSALQRWTVESLGQGVFRFVSAANGNLALDITGASGKNGANVELWSKNSSTAQKLTPQATSPSIPASASVGDGWYSLQSCLNSGYQLDVTGCNSANGTKLELWTANTTTAQMFYFQKVGGYYRISSGVGGGANLDVEAGKPVPGTKAEVWKSTTNCALFSLQRNADGSIQLLNVASGLALGVYSGDASKGVVVTAEHYLPGAASQSFRLVSHPGLLAEGFYSVKTALSGSRTLGPKSGSQANGAGMAISSYNGGFYQKWQVKAVSGKTNVYTLEDIDTGYRLQAVSSKTALQRPSSNVAAQWWQPEGANGGYLLKNIATGQYLDVSGANAKEGTAVITWKKNGGVNQKWNLSKVNAIDSGIYEFVLAGNKGVALDVEKASEADAANVEIWTRNNGANQRWYYNASAGTLVSMCSGKALDVSGASKASGANVIQYSLNEGANQKWTVSYDEGGTWKISSGLGGGLVLGASSSASGANVANAADKQALTQRWIPVAKERVLASSLKNSISFVDLTNVRGIGIDVSFWQGNINWAKVKQSGVDFAILRVGHGVSTSDSQLKNYVRGCQSVGIPFGLYYYSTAKNVSQARAEAAHALKVMRDAGATPGNTSYAVYYDLEEGSVGKVANRKLLANMAEEFLSTMQANGYKAGVYANLNWWNNYLTDSAFNKWERWIAQWGVSRCGYVGKRTMWQTTSSGTVPGISGRVDIDVRY